LNATTVEGGLVIRLGDLPVEGVIASKESAFQSAIGDSLWDLIKSSTSVAVLTRRGGVKFRTFFFVTIVSDPSEALWRKQQLAGS
jgi:hypothetical protein